MNKKVKRTVALRIMFRDTERTPQELTELVRHALNGFSEKPTVTPLHVVEETKYLFKGDEE